LRKRVAGSAKDDVRADAELFRFSVWSDNILVAVRTPTDW
jgi:hypothetical protein